jgi:hypothetical protein
MKQTDIAITSFSDTLFNTDLIATRVVIATAELIWAVTLLWPGDIFQRPAYAHMALMANEMMWGFLFLVTGMTQLGIAMYKDTESKFSKYFAGWNAGVWIYTVVSLYMSVYPPPAAISGELALAMAATWIWAKPLVLKQGEVYAARESSA